MNKRIDLISDQDLQAFADGQVHGERLFAIQDLIKRDAQIARRVEHLVTRNRELRVLRSALLTPDLLAKIAKAIRPLCDEGSK